MSGNSTGGSETLRGVVSEGAPQTTARSPHQSATATGGSDDTSVIGVLLMTTKYLYLFLDQILIMSLKHVSQKQRKGRQFLKDTFMMQFFILSFFTFILYQAAQQTTYEAVYSSFSLPPLSTKSPYGIFSQDSKGNDPDTIISKKLIYR